MERGPTERERAEGDGETVEERRRRLGKKFAPEVGACSGCAHQADGQAGGRTETYLSHCQRCRRDFYAVKGDFFEVWGA